MQRGTLPNPLERIRRDPVALWGVLVVALVTVSMASVADRTVFRIEGEVSANWRGAYDLLVRPPGARLDLERTNGVVEPNFISFAGAGGISIGQLDAIRRLDGVEVAAPIGFVGYVRYVLSSPLVHLPAPPSQPTLFRVTLSATTNDGTRDLLVQRQSGLLLLGPGSGPEAVQRWATNLGSITGGQRADGATVYELSATNSLPAIASPVMAVDPVAEMDLLGPSSSFLDQLARVPSASRTAATFDHESIPDGFAFARSQLRFASRSESDAVRGRPIVPLVVSDRIYASLRLRLEVDQLGVPLTSYPSGEAARDILAAAVAQAGPSVTSIGAAQTDLTASLRPLQLTEVAVAWPGVTDFESVSAFSEFRDFAAGIPTRPRYRAVPSRPGSDADIAFEIAPVGIVGPDGGSPQPSPLDDPLALQLATGREAAYRELREVPLAAAEGFTAAEPGDQPFFFAPLGEFDLSRLDLPTEALSHVPFGAYDPPHTELLGSAPGSSPTAMSPTLNPAGMIMVPPLALTDLAGAVTLRGDRPIDAIRIRVAGVSGFTAEGRARIERVAEALLAMGLDVDVVAGSSPQPVDVFVPGYVVQGDETEDLGWVRQEWTTLGAAERVVRGLTGGATEILILGVAAAVVAAGAVQAVRATTRRREMAVLMASGWAERDVLVWVLSEALIAAVIVLGLGLVVWAAGGAGALTGAALLVVALSLLAAPAVSLRATRIRIGTGGPAVQAGDVYERAPRLPAVRGPATLGIRNVTSRPIRSVVLVLALAGASSALSLVGTVVAEASQTAGPTKLASAVSQVIEPSLLLTLGAVVAANAVALVAMWRLDSRSRAGEAAALVAAGWSRTELLLSRAAAGVVVSMPAAAIGAAITLAAAAAIAGADPPAAAVGAVILAPFLGIVGPLVVGVAVDPLQRP